MINSAPISPSKFEALSRLLSAWGHDARDFVVETDQTSELAELFELTGGILKVRRCSTGEERLYAAGVDSAWFCTLLMDLARGRLPEPSRSARPQLRAPRSLTH